MSYLDLRALYSGYGGGAIDTSGTMLKVYGFDDDNASRILHIADVDLKGKINNVRVWELD